ncbi:ABC transporter permease [Rhodococcus ruber]|uniref:ABC transporter permease n=1 Tax=Rhodococcus ruber TaxID=1830 RepID=UPI0037836F51
MTVTVKALVAQHGVQAGTSITIPAKRVGSHRRAIPSAFPQWAALTWRTVRSMVRTGGIYVSMLSPVVFGLGFYLPLKYVMQFQGIDYAQFVMPIIVLQAMAFTAISAAQLSSMEGTTGFSTRMQTMPVASAVPLLSRISAGVVRSLVSLTAAIAFGYAIGFRFFGGWQQILLFSAIAMAFSITLSLGADAIGSLSKSPEATAQALTLPQLILGMLSCGFAPESGFPEWIRPFVRNQPVSQYSFALRDLAEGNVTWSVLFPSAAWTVGLLIAFLPLALWASLRRE